MFALIQEINILHSNKVPENNIPSQLSPWATALYNYLPPFIRRELLLHQDSDNSAQLSQVCVFWNAQQSVIHGNAIFDVKLFIEIFRLILSNS
jgi:hypothetical protein